LIFLPLAQESQAFPGERGKVILFKQVSAFLNSQQKLKPFNPFVEANGIFFNDFMCGMILNIPFRVIRFTFNLFKKLLILYLQPGNIFLEIAN
jgi:hypothetical protein